MLRNLESGVHRLLKAAAVQAHRFLRAHPFIGNRRLQRYHGIDRESRPRFWQPVSLITHFRVPQADQIPARGESAGDIFLRPHMEVPSLFPDQPKPPGKVLHDMPEQILFPLQLIGQNKHMIPQAVELIRHRPAFRQVPYIHKPAARHQQDKGPFVRSCLRRREPHQVHSLPRRIRRAFFLAIKRIIPFPAVCRGVQALKSFPDFPTEVLLPQLRQRLLPHFFPAQVPLPDRVRSNLRNPLIRQPLSQRLFHFFSRPFSVFCVFIIQAPSLK